MSITRRILLGFAAIALGLAYWALAAILGLHPSDWEIAPKIIHTLVGFGIMGFFIYRWSIRR